MNDTPRIKARSDRGTWEVIYWRTVDGRRKRIRESCKTQGEAKERQKELIDERKLAGEAWSTLPAIERADLMLVASEIYKAGYSVRQVWDGFRRGTASAGAVKKILLGKAIDEFIADCETSKCRPATVKSRKQYLVMFARGREQMPVDTIGHQAIKLWFKERNEAISAHQSNFGKFDAFFKFLMREEYLPKNGNPMGFLVRPKSDQTPPRVLTPEQFEKLLDKTPTVCPRIFGWVVGGLLCGLRPDEPLYNNEEEQKIKISWDKDIDLKRGTIRVLEAATKVRGRRIVHLKKLNPTAIAWLEFAKNIGAHLPVSKQFKIKAIKKLRTIIGVDQWPQDILRHTAASLFIAKHENVAYVAKELGTSADILTKNYHDPIPQDIAKRLLAKLPPKKMPIIPTIKTRQKRKRIENQEPADGKIIQMPMAATAVNAQVI